MGFMIRNGKENAATQKFGPRQAIAMNPFGACEETNFTNAMRTKPGGRSKEREIKSGVSSVFFGPRLKYRRERSSSGEVKPLPPVTFFAPSTFSVHKFDDAKKEKTVMRVRREEGPLTHLS